MPQRRRDSVPQRRRDSVWFTVVVTTLVVLGALVTAVVVMLAGAPGAVVLATVLAAVPVGPAVACLMWLDRYEPEPRLLLASGLGWGAFVATTGALLLGAAAGLAGLARDVQLVWVAPVTEEATKGLFLLLLLWWRRHELDGILDGLVYAGMVGVGFAFIENILYLTAAWNGGLGPGDGGVEAVTTVFIMRCLLSPFAHPLFTAMTGIGVGVAVSSRTGVLRLFAPVAGYAGAVVTHAVWNAAAAGSIGGFLGVYAGLMVPVLVAVVLLALWLRRTEPRMLRQALADAAGRGLLPAGDIGWVVSLGARRRSRQHARRAGGPGAEHAMRDYQQAVVELGFLHHRYLRGTPPADFAARGQRLCSRIRDLRSGLGFPVTLEHTR